MVLAIFSWLTPVERAGDGAAETGRTLGAVPAHQNHSSRRYFAWGEDGLAVYGSSPNPWRTSNFRDSFTPCGTAATSSKSEALCVLR